MLHAKIVAHFVRDNEPRGEANVFVDVAAALHITHALHTGQAKRATWAIVAGAEIVTELTSNIMTLRDKAVPSQEDRIVVMRDSGTLAVDVVDFVLPLAKR